MKDTNSPNYIFEAEHYNSFKSRFKRFRKNFKKNFKKWLNNTRQNLEYLYTLIIKREQ